MEVALSHQPGCTANCFGRVYPPDGNIAEILRNHISVLNGEAERNRALATTAAVTDEARGYWEGVADGYTNAAAAITHLLNNNDSKAPTTA